MSRPPADRSVRDDVAGGPAESELSTALDVPDAVSLGGRSWRWRLLTRMVALATLAFTVVVAALVAWSVLWAPNPDDSVHLVNGRLIGETWGYVARVDRERRTVAVSQSVFGWHPVVLAVAPETTITVQQREGGLGDLVSDMLVRVIYEVVGERRVARSIDIGGSRPESVRSPATAARPPAARAIEPAPAPRAVDGTAPAASAVERPAPVAPSLPVSVVPPTAAPAGRGAPREPATTTRSSPVATSPAPSSAPIVPTARAESRGSSSREDVRADVAVPRPSTDTDPADGSAAIDWLIDEYQRR